MKPPGDRRARPERRDPRERRHAELSVAVERRSGRDRRSGSERRGPASLDAQLRNALELLTNVAEAGTLDDQSLRDLDTAIFRLRFVLDELERGT